MKKSILWPMLSIVTFIALSLACGGTPTPEPTLSPDRIVASAEPYTVFIEARFPGDREGSGTGIIFHEDGWIVTNAHVVESASAIRVRAPDRGELAAQLFGVSPCDDLAVIKVPGAGFKKAVFGDSNNLNPGEDVIAIGYPLGRPDISVTRGVVSRLHETLDQLQDLIQTDASVNPGNSGGPLLNMKGEVVGIITIKVQYDRAGNPIEGTAFAISSNIANDLVPELTQPPYRHWLGLNTIPLQDINREAGLEGLLIIGVSDNSPAERAGLQPLDVILTMQGMSINSMSDLCDVIRRVGPGDTLSYEILRDGQIISTEDQEVASEATPTPPSTLTPTPSPTPQGMKTYTNRMLGFSLQYPEDWTIEEKEDEVDVSCSTPPISFSVLVDKRERPGTPQEVVDEWITVLKSKYPDLELADTRELTVDGVEAVAQGAGLVTESGTKVAIAIVGVVKGDLEYSIITMGELADVDEMTETLTAMHNSFRFLEEEAALAVTPTPGLTLLFEDDFSDPTCRWDEISDADIEMGCQQSQYRFRVNKAGVTYISLPTRHTSSADFLLRAQVKQAEGPDRSLHGVVFRHQDSKHYYLFAIRGDGYYAILKNENGFEYLVNWTPSDTINQAPDRNSLAVGAVGSRFLVSINGQTVDEFVDDSFQIGGFGLAVGTFPDEPDAPLIYFDDVEFWEYGP